MKAILYIHIDAVKYNGTNTNGFVKNLKKFVRDLQEIDCWDAANNKIVVSEDIWIASVCNGMTFPNFINKYLERDEVNFMYQILANTSNKTNITYRELQENSIYKSDEKECISLIVLNELKNESDEISSEENQVPQNPYMTFDNYQIVYGRDSWFCLRRQILANHPGDANSFMQDCRKYFPDLTFSKDCENRLETKYLVGIPRKIVYYLSCINDCFSNFRKNHANPNSINLLLADFSGIYGMDEAASMQRTPEKKEQYSFEFYKYKSRTTKKVCCDPHFKIRHYDENCLSAIKEDGEKCYGRIYFNLGDTDIHPTNILIGSIGPHV